MHWSGNRFLLLGRGSCDINIISECRSGPATISKPVSSSPRIATRNGAVIVFAQAMLDFDDLGMLLVLSAEVRKHTSAEGEYGDYRISSYSI